MNMFDRIMIEIRTLNSQQHISLTRLDNYLSCRSYRVCFLTMPSSPYVHSIEQPKASIPDKKKRPSTSPLKQKSKAPPPVVVIADSTSARVSSSIMHSAGRVALKSSALDMSTGSAVSTDPGGDDDDEDEEEIEESQSQAALDATGASQVSVPDDTEYDEVFEESTIKIEKWEDEEDDDREDEDEDEDEEEDYSRENDDKWEDDEDDVVDDVKSDVKQSGMERPVKYEEPDRPKFASFAGNALSSLFVLYLLVMSLLPHLVPHTALDWSSCCNCAGVLHVFSLSHACSAISLFCCCLCLFLLSVFFAVCVLAICVCVCDCSTYLL